MTVYHDKARDRWRYDFVLKGTRYSGYCVDPQTGAAVSGKRAAERVEAQAKEAARQPIAQAPTVAGSYTLAQAIEAYALTVQHLPAWEGCIKGYLREFLSYFGAGKALQDIGLTELSEYVVWAQQQHVRVRIGGPDKAKKLFKEIDRKRSISTVNRYLGTLKAVMSKAHKTRAAGSRIPLLDYVPEFPKLREPQHVPRPWSLEELQAVRRVASPHVGEAMTLAVLTGLRKQSCLALRVQDVDLTRQVVHKGVHNKGKKDGDIPIPPAAIPFFEGLITQARERGSEYLITFRARGSSDWVPISDIKRSFKTAQSDSGIQSPKRFHALKTTAISFASEAGADIRTLQAIGDHADSRTTERHYVGEAVGRRKTAMEGVGQRLISAGILTGPDRSKAVPDEESSSDPGPGVPVGS